MMVKSCHGDIEPVGKPDPPFTFPATCIRTNIALRANTNSEDAATQASLVLV
jgi:hypothetical protein